MHDAFIFWSSIGSILIVGFALGFATAALLFRRAAIGPQSTGRAS